MALEDAPRCTHITVTGHRCGSPALRKQHFCYFHTRMIKGVDCRVDMHIEPNALFESPEAVQAALMQVYSDMVEGRIEDRKAALLLKALNLAASLSRRANFDQGHWMMVTKVPDWEKQYLKEHPEKVGVVSQQSGKAAAGAQVSAVSSEATATAGENE